MQALWSKVLAVTLLIFVGCSSIKKKIQIDSTPGNAKVSIFLSNTRAYKTIGKTPFKIDSDEIKKLIPDNQDYVSIRISKKGHAIEHLIIDRKLRNKISYVANLNPIDIWTDNTTELSSIVANKLAQKVQNINNNILRKDLPKALGKTQKLIEQYPKASVFYDMKGSILYLMGKKKESLASYAKSLSLNPDNVLSKKMIERIQK